MVPPQPISMSSACTPTTKTSSAGLAVGADGEIAWWRAPALGVPARQPCRGEHDGPAGTPPTKETLLRGDPLLQRPEAQLEVPEQEPRPHVGHDVAYAVRDLPHLAVAERRAAVPPAGQQHAEPDLVADQRHQSERVRLVASKTHAGQPDELVVVDQPGTAAHRRLDEMADTTVDRAGPAGPEPDAPHRLNLAGVVEQDGGHVDLEPVGDLLDRQLGQVILVQPLGGPVQEVEQPLDRGGDLVEVGDSTDSAVAGRGAVRRDCPAVVK